MSQKALTYVILNVPNWVDAYQVVWLKFDGTDGSTVITDDNLSGVARTWTANGSAQLDTSSFELGTAALLVQDSPLGYVTTQDVDDFVMGDRDWTIATRFLINPADAGGVQRLLAGQIDNVASLISTSFYIERHTSGAMRVLVGFGAASNRTVSTPVAYTGSTNPGWHELIVQKRGSRMELYIDRVLVATNTNMAGVTINTSTASLSVGRAGDIAGANWYGSIDNFQVWLGVALMPLPSTTPETAFLVDEFQALSFAIDAAYLPPKLITGSTEFDIVPSVRDVSFAPGTISLGKDLGTRSTVTVTLSDHRHVFHSEDYDSGTFWGKFHARYGLTLRGNLAIVYQGDLSVRAGTNSQDLDTMPGRFYVIDSCEGPHPSDHTYKIVLKDIIKLADDDRAQAPVPSNGFLNASITNVATAATLAPSGIGDAEYPAAGYVAIANEVCSFTRVADALTLTRAQFNTTGVAHDANDRVQLCLQYNGDDAADIIHDLFVNYAGISSSYINVTNWQAETNSFLGTVYTRLIAEPTGVNKLVSELIEQAALAVWWDDRLLNIRLQVLRPIGTDVRVYGDDNIIDGSLETKEQPDKRVSEVYTYFGQISPLENQDQLKNFRSSAYTTDDVASSAYGSKATRTIRSAWIPSGGRSIADILNNKVLARFVDPPRRLTFEVPSLADIDPELGQGYIVRSWAFQDIEGNPVDVPVQVTRLVPLPDRFRVEAEEMLWTAYGIDVDPGERIIIFDASENDVNLRTRHDQLYPTPQSGDLITVIVNAGVTIGSTSSSTPAMDVGTWPGGVSISIEVNGRVQGKGGTGGYGGGTGGLANGQAGQTGGTALYTRTAVSLTDASGELFGGGGGGGGGAIGFIGGGGGGGGAGTLGGDGQVGGPSGPSGLNGSSSAGGAGGAAGGTGSGGDGGVPGVAGNTGASTGFGAGGAGGAAGNAIDGVSFVTTVGSAGDRRGGQVN